MNLLVYSDLHWELARFEPSATDFDVVVPAHDIETDARGMTATSLSGRSDRSQFKVVMHLRDGH